MLPAILTRRTGRRDSCNGDAAPRHRGQASHDYVPCEPRHEISSRSRSSGIRFRPSKRRRRPEDRSSRVATDSHRTRDRRKSNRVRTFSPSCLSPSRPSAINAFSQASLPEESLECSQTMRVRRENRNQTGSPIAVDDASVIPAGRDARHRGQRRMARRTQLHQLEVDGDSLGARTGEDPPSKTEQEEVTELITA